MIASLSSNEEMNPCKPCKHVYGTFVIFRKLTSTHCLQRGKNPKSGTKNIEPSKGKRIKMTHFLLQRLTLERIKMY